MTDLEFRAAIAELVADRQFWRIVADIEQSDGLQPPDVATERDPFALPGSGSRLLDLTDDETPTSQPSGSVNTGDL